MSDKQCEPTLTYEDEDCKISITYKPDDEFVFDNFISILLDPLGATLWPKNWKAWRTCGVTEESEDE